jgi:molecular chaperone GrpE
MSWSELSAKKSINFFGIRSGAASRKGVLVDQATKDALLDQFRSYLEGLEDGADAKAPADSGADDLHSIFVEIAALRNETRAQSRLTKEAFDQFRGVFETLRGSGAALEQQLKDAKARETELRRVLLRPLLLDILDIRDRLSAAVATPPPQNARLCPLRRLVPSAFLGPWDRLSRRPEPETEPDPWREGVAMTLRRLDQALASRRVAPIAVVGKPFQPTLARAVSVVEDRTAADGIVLAELRTGFTFEDDLLRLAEVTVSRRVQAADRRDEGGI